MEVVMLNMLLALYLTGWVAMLGGYCWVFYSPVRMSRMGGPFGELLARAEDNPAGVAATALVLVLVAATLWPICVGTVLLVQLWRAARRFSIGEGQDG